jgi:hypothetical protein
VTAPTGRRDAVLDMVAARGPMSLPQVETEYRSRGWRPGSALADLQAAVQAGDLAASGQGAARTWCIDLSRLIGGTQ